MILSGPLSSTNYTVDIQKRWGGGLFSSLLLQVMGKSFALVHFISFGLVLISIKMLKQQFNVL